MRALPLFHDLRDRLCLVIGQGEIAARKAAALRAVGANVRMASGFDAGDLAGTALVVVAEAPETIAHAACDACRARGIPINAVDRPAYCTVTWPAIIDRDPVTIAIGTGGTAPLLAARLRTRIEQAVPHTVAVLAAIAERWRPLVKRQLPDTADRRHFWQRFFTGAVAQAALAGDRAGAQRHAIALLANSRARPRLGHVHLVGAGPGDPELLTLRALRLIQSAEIIVHDRLVATEVLDLASREARRIDVGKRRATACMPQAQINALLVRLAREGARVVRLKGGDPFMFGRGGEEIEALIAAGVPFDVTPGVTAALGCAAYAGIPLTHRDHAHSCVFVTGHRRDGRLDLNWRMLAQPGQTIAIYMGVHALPELSRQLQGHGLSATLPAALIVDGTRPSQRVLAGTLADLPAIVAADQQLDRSAPGLVIVGEVAAAARRMPAGARPGSFARIAAE
ncbi:uroporphyrinogen-III C-methyltransferase [Vineibacter terrae]|uniref:Uroporphyrinogen-III C-methyltransferase n=1 Tax=Vineibacter terrae TaxID=2586908 RepID=A0A5C8PD82_9HYPH|nr:siroheme synthase CysG [Vineibacter terrae]TXL71516.1 uroporphyrinogen-III C-methyltransferase [Vineibacter terrae]